jgi:hypothetical protein
MFAIIFVLFMSLFSASLAMERVPDRYRMSSEQLKQSMKWHPLWQYMDPEVQQGLSMRFNRRLAAQRSMWLSTGIYDCLKKTMSQPLQCYGLRLRELPDEIAPDEIVGEKFKLKKLYINGQRRYLNAFAEYWISRFESNDRLLTSFIDRLELPDAFTNYWGKRFYKWFTERKEELSIENSDDFNVSITCFKNGETICSLLHLMLENILTEDVSQDDKCLHYCIVNELDNKLIGGVRIFYNEGLNKFACDVWFNKECEERGLGSNVTLNVIGQFCCDLDVRD